MFSSDDLDAILDATGEEVIITLSGVTVATINGKFREDYETVSPYESVSGILKPAVLLKTSDLAGITNDHTYVIRGTEYKRDGKPQKRGDGFTLVTLGVKL